MKDEGIFFIDKVDEIDVCDGKFYYFTGSSFRKPTDYIKIENDDHNLETCEKCRNGHASLLDGFKKKLANFPFCCDHHSKLAKEKWFKKSDYSSAANFGADKTFSTWHFILKFIEDPNWESEIKDYIHYVVHTFGSFPHEFGEPLFLSHYFKSLKELLNSSKTKNTERKAKILIDYINSFNKKSDTDLNILLGIYNQWYKTFPFHLSIFSKLKGHFSKTLPIIEKTHYNKYLETELGTPVSKENLIKSLIATTNKIVTELNSLKLYEKGNLSDIENYELELAIEQRKLKLAEGYTNNSQDENTRYRKILKAWLKDELAFIKIISPKLKIAEEKKNNLFLDILFACSRMQENKLFWKEDENARTKQILELLELNYNTKDQTQIGISAKKKKPGSLDGLILDKNRVQHFIEALNVKSVEKKYIGEHINKLEENYDSKGLRNKFLIVYCNIPDNSFEEFYSRYLEYIDQGVDFKFQKQNIEKIESAYVNQRIIKTTHMRESKEIAIYHILLKMPI